MEAFGRVHFCSSKNLTKKIVFAYLLAVSEDLKVRNGLIKSHGGHRSPFLVRKDWFEVKIGQKVLRRVEVTNVSTVRKVNNQNVVRKEIETEKILSSLKAVNSPYSAIKGELT